MENQIMTLPSKHGQSNDAPAYLNMENQIMALPI
jgi:hypothetical protein